MTKDIGPQIDETGWERPVVRKLTVRIGDLRYAASLDREQLRDLVAKLLAPYGATDYEVSHITNALAAQLRDRVPPADSPPPQSREERLYRQ